MQKTDQQNRKQFIDIDNVIKNRKSKFLKMMPRFVINWIKRIICQDGINGVVNRSSHKDGIYFIKSVLEDFNTKIKIIGRENINPNERYVFASNHPLGGIDGLAFIDAVWELGGETRAIINDLLLNIKNFYPVFLGVNTFGKSSRDKIRVLEEAFASDFQIAIFPAGLVSRKQGKKIEDLEWKKTFITKAVQHKRNVIPVHIEGKLSNTFYNVAKFRKFFGMKTNIELFLLPREFLNQKNKELTIHFGEPISYKHFDKSRTQAEWAQEVKRISYELHNSEISR